jgi:hypothetical protein
MLLFILLCLSVPPNPPATVAKLVYLHRLQKRLNELGMPPTDAIYRNVGKSIEALQDLGMSIHYRSCSGGVAGADRCPE